MEGTDNQTQTKFALQLLRIAMIKCTSYGPDKLNLLPFYHLTFKCDLDLQPT